MKYLCIFKEKTFHYFRYTLEDKDSATNLIFCSISLSIKYLMFSELHKHVVGILLPVVTGWLKR